MFDLYKTGCARVRERVRRLASIGGGVMPGPKLSLVPGLSCSSSIAPHCWCWQLFDVACCLFAQRGVRGMGSGTGHKPALYLLGWTWKSTQTHATNTRRKSLTQNYDSKPRFKIPIRRTTGRKVSSIIAKNTLLCNATYVLFTAIQHEFSVEIVIFGQSFE